MSELTSGSLSLLKYKRAVLDYDPVYAEDLNDKWFVFVTKDTEVSEEIPESLFQISEKNPSVIFL